MSDKIRIFIGADDSQKAAARVLEYSIRKHATLPVEFEVMKDLPVPMPKDKKNRPQTGFSFYRFMVPQLAGFKGRAIYLDADMIAFGDIAEVWKLPFNGKKLLCTVQNQTPAGWAGKNLFHPGRQMSVLLMDCAKLKWDIHDIIHRMDAGDYDYRQLLFEMCILEPQETGETIPPEWNSLEHYEEGKTKLLHYTVGHLQPWRNDRNPLKGIWENLYREAVGHGLISKNEVEKEIRSGLLKPSLAGAFPGTSGLAGRFGRYAAWGAGKIMRRIKA